MTKKIIVSYVPSENQALLEALKTEYSQTWLSEVEKRELAQAIQDEKNRPVSTNIYANNDLNIIPSISNTYTDYR